MSKEKARDGYMTRPTAMWNERRKSFICPDCYQPILMELADGGSKYKVPADALYFRRETKQNHKCECGAVLWAMLVPGRQSEWVKISDYGFVHRKMAYQALDGVKKKPHIYDAIKDVADNPDGIFPSAGAYNRFPLSTYIKRQMKGKIDGLIIDELHHYGCGI